MSLDLFHPLIRQWFQGRFDAPTEPQSRGWPHIAADHHTLIAAPTGSGKTLSAFLVYVDRLFRQWIDRGLDDEIQVVYVSPLKALSNDIERNLRQPLAEIREMAEQAGMETPPIRVALRTGDTSSGERQKMLRRPPHILVTTPESLYLLITSEKGRERLRTVKTVIVDEIHALARDKRGSHLALTLARLDNLCETPPTRVGLSATQKPIGELANFLVGEQTRSNLCATGSASAESKPGNEDTGRASGTHGIPCQIVDAGHVRDLDLSIEVPPSELSAVCSNEQWVEIYERIVELVNGHRSTLIFVNTRRLAERMAHTLRDLLGEEAVAAHHGSLSRSIRLDVEQRLKSGQLKAIVATASLEMGIDIGYIDLVCQIGSPRAIATFLQRVGRSGHTLRATPKGRLFPLTRDELLECMALVRAVGRGDLDRIEIPEKPLDILAQQIIAEAACGECDEEELFEQFRQAWPYRNLERKEFDTIVSMASEGVAGGSKRGAYLHRDQINGRIRARRSARIAALTSGGAIPETAEFRVITEQEKTFVGTVDEDFAIESLPGDVFLLGNTSWRIRYIRGGEVVVNDAQGAPPNIPFWFGEAPGRTIELSHEISNLRHEIGERVVSGSPDPPTCDDRRSQEARVESLMSTVSGDLRSDECRGRETTTLHTWLTEDCGVGEWAARQAVRYVEAQKAAIGLVPTKDDIVFERFFDESGGMQLVIHSPLGARINRAWGLALRKRFCRSFDFELQAAATEDGIVLSIGPQHSFPIENLFKMLRTDNGRDLLEQALLVAPMFQIRWRWNVTRALGVLRFDKGKKVPPFLQRFRSDDLLAAAFPQTVGCLENHSGDIEIPDHPLVAQTMVDCLTEAMDIDRWLSLLGDVEAGRVRLIARDTREPSPFSHQILNANPYAFLDDAPLEERRSRAVATRRSLSVEEFKDLAQLDPEAIAQVRRQAWPLVRDPDELHDAMVSLVLVSEFEIGPWQQWLEALVAEGRATCVSVETRSFWIATERWPMIRATYKDATCEPVVELPDELKVAFERSKGWMEVVRGRIQHTGPTTVEELAEQLCLEPSQVESALEALEAEGVSMRGQFTSPDAREWCERRLLACIHRLTMEGLRRQIEPVEPTDFMRFLVGHHQLDSELGWGGPVGAREAIGQLQGFELPAGGWEKHILQARIGDYDPQWLDQLFMSGEVVWGRLQRPRPSSDQRRMAAMTRSVPISLMLRDELAWLLPSGSTDGHGYYLRSNASEVYAALSQRGALFFKDLQKKTEIMPTHLEEALRELAALGLVTSDAFAAVRAIVTARKSRRGRIPNLPNPLTPIGRWSCFPGQVDVADPVVRAEHWCKLLLRRYGVVFRELLARETAAPRWYELVAMFRRMEMRGEVRGGRFVSGVAGEQFATEDAVTRLRNVRDTEPDGNWVVLSAADPLNLQGIINDEERLPATHRNALVLRDGCCVAKMESRQIEFLDDEIDSQAQWQMRRAIQLGRKPTADEKQELVAGS